MKLVKGKYTIEYANGIKQEKNLISHRDFTTIIQPLNYLIDYFDSENKDELKNLLKNSRKELIGEDDYFTDESGLFKASKTGILELVEHMGGNTKCIVKLIK